MIKDERLTLRLPAATRRALEARAQVERRTVGDMARLILEGGLDVSNTTHGGDVSIVTLLVKSRQLGSTERVHELIRDRLK